MPITHDPIDKAHGGPGVIAALFAFVVFLAIAIGAYTAAQRPDPGRAGGGPGAGDGDLAGAEDRRARDILHEKTVDEPRLEAFAFLGGTRRVVRSEEFRAADVVAILGDCELDLTGADLAAGGGRIEAFVLFGNMQIRVPRDWTVVRDDQVIFGRFENRLETDRADPTKKVRLEAVVVMGEIEVTH